MDVGAAIAAQNFFSLVHPEFYEAISYHPLSPEYVDRLKELLPDAWILQRNDVWVHARCPASKRATTAPVIQGFKIHVSSAPMYALRVLDIVVPVCVEEDIDFKIAGDPSLLHVLNSKQQGRGYSGKFMTIYPPDEEISQGPGRTPVSANKRRGGRGTIYPVGPAIQRQQATLLPIWRVPSPTSAQYRRDRDHVLGVAHRRVCTRPAVTLLSSARLGPRSLRQCAECGA